MKREATSRPPRAPTASCLRQSQTLGLSNKFIRHRPRGHPEFREGSGHTQRVIFFATIVANRPDPSLEAQDAILRAMRIGRILDRRSLEKLLQIHSGIHRRDLIAVAVVHERFALAKFAEATLARLTPA